MVSNGGEMRCYHGVMCIFLNVIGYHPMYHVYQGTHKFEHELEHDVEHNVEYESKFKLMKGKKNSVHTVLRF